MENHITLCSDNSVKRNKGNFKTFLLLLKRIQKKDMHTVYSEILEVNFFMYFYFRKNCSNFVLFIRAE